VKNIVTAPRHPDGGDQHSAAKTEGDPTPDSQPTILDPDNSVSEPASDPQMRFLAALEVPAPPGVTKAEATALIGGALAAGREVSKPEAFGAGPPSAGMVAALAAHGVTGVAVPETWAAASALLSKLKAAGLPPTRCRQGMHPRTEEHGHMYGQGGAYWRCGSCAGRPPSQSAVSDLVWALAVEQPFQFGIRDLAVHLRRGENTVSAVVRQLEAEGRVTIRREPGLYGRKLVGAIRSTP
jgi:hypothetical protein